MTMPHLMNCDHIEDGWCLDCVKKLHDNFENMLTALELLANTRYEDLEYEHPAWDAMYAAIKKAKSNE